MKKLVFSGIFVMLLGGVVVLSCPIISEGPSDAMLIQNVEALAIDESDIECYETRAFDDHGVAYKTCSRSGCGPKCNCD